MSVLLANLGAIFLINGLNLFSFANKAAKGNPKLPLSHLFLFENGLNGSFLVLVQGLT